jgi:hypothetical protein
MIEEFDKCAVCSGIVFEYWGIDYKSGRVQGKCKKCGEIRLT